MKISVVIPLYNSVQSIKKTLDSVVHQSLEVPIEIHIVNDGSTDQGEKVVQDYIAQHRNPRISIQYYQQENKGVSTARNRGLEHSTGEYIAMLDSDDEWYPHKLARQVEVLEKYPEIDFLGSARNEEATWVLGKKIDTLHKITVKELFIKMYPQTSTAIFKRTLFERLGGYDENLRYAEDGDLWIRYCASSNFYYLPESLVYTGNGKPHFGHSGISGNLQAMQIGNQNVLKDARNKGLIGPLFYYFIYYYSKIKYLRRILLTKAHKL